MKNLKYYPFERNKYFFGKLLTVGDFETEQKYVNDKRRLINRFLHGSGVVCGMNVVRVDDMAISVEMGLALDFSGREIFIDSPVIKKLSMIEGFESEGREDLGYMYLCIEYGEYDKEPVHSIAGMNMKSSEEIQHNKYAEGYRFFLTNQEPDNNGFTNTRFYIDSKTVYCGNGIRISHSIPKYIQSSDELELLVTVEKMEQQQKISFEYDINLTCLKAEGKEMLKVEFDESKHAEAKRYVLRYSLNSMGVKDAEGFAEVDSKSFKLFVGGKQVNVEPSCKNVTRIVEGNIKREIIRQYYLMAMEDILKNSYQQSIYLAKINIIRAGSAYVIEDIEGMPFKQYVFNSTIGSILDDINISELEKMQNNLKSSKPEQPKVHKEKSKAGGVPMQMSSGTEVISLGIGGNENQRYYSREIVHNLGLGQVHIVLGQACSASDDSAVVYGEAEVFDNNENMPSVKLAAKVDVTKGTFVIGVQMKKASNISSIKVNWMAYKDSKEAVYEADGKKLFVKPDMEEIEVRASCYLEAVFVNVSDKRVKWHVKEKEGGTIDGNGLYTAPNNPGVYEIVVESIACPQLKASAYVVVRDNTSNIVPT